MEETERQYRDRLASSMRAECGNTLLGCLIGLAILIVTATVVSAILWKWWAIAVFSGSVGASFVYFSRISLWETIAYYRR